MNREIKFRAWDKNEERMFIVRSLHIEVSVVRDNSLTFYELNDIKLMQFTGLKDKNGVEIYEGDIVQHSDDAKDTSVILFGEFGVPNIEEQEYQDVALGFYFENASELKDIEPFNMTIPLNANYVKNVKVIGNVYDNPELLESGVIVDG